MKNHDEAAFGQFGCALTTGTEIQAPAGKVIVAITSLSSASVTATSEDNTVWPDLDSVSVPTGVTIYGRWSAANVANETAILYFG